MARFEFYIKDVEVPEESEKAGKPVFRQEEWVKVIKPKAQGEPEETPMPIRQAMEMVGYIRARLREAEKNGALRPSDPDRLIPEHFDRGYEAFKRGEVATGVGTPLSQWPMATKELVDRCQRQGLRTVEDLRACNDEMLNTLGPGARGWREKAKAYLEVDASKSQAAARLAALEAEVEALKNAGNKKDKLIADQDREIKSKKAA